MVCHKHNIDPCSKCQTRLHYGGIIAGCVNECGIASFQFPSHSSAQHGNIVHRRLERLRVGIVVVLVDEVDSFEPAKITKVSHLFKMPINKGFLKSSNSRMPINKVV